MAIGKTNITGFKAPEKMGVFSIYLKLRGFLDTG